MARDHARFVPSSLLRIRCFIHTDTGLKVKPWATTDETLDAFSHLLLIKRHDDGFWQDLEELMGKLSGDLNKRVDPHLAVVDNEVLDAGAHGRLLEEIRNALDGRHAPSGGFRNLASRLSVPAVGLLCLLGGVVTLGCETDTSLQGNSDAVTDTARDTAPDTAEDTSVDTFTDPDVPDDPACPHEGLTIAQIIAECVPGEYDRNYFNECITGLHDSWSTGLADHFACSTCPEVYDDLTCIIYNGFTEFCDADATGEFTEEDLQMFLDNCGVLLYLGVRFE